jgi:hypothetical protein
MGWMPNKSKYAMEIGTTESAMTNTTISRIKIRAPFEGPVTPICARKITSFDSVGGLFFAPLGEDGAALITGEPSLFSSQGHWD